MSRGFSYSCLLCMGVYRVEIVRILPRKYVEICGDTTVIMSPEPGTFSGAFIVFRIQESIDILASWPQTLWVE